MDDAKANEVIAAINAISDDLKKDLEKKFLPREEAPGRDESGLNGILKRLSTLEKQHKDMLSDIEKKGHLIESNRKVNKKNTKDIDELRAKIKEIEKELGIEQKLVRLE